MGKTYKDSPYGKKPIWTSKKTSKMGKADDKQ